MSESILIGTKKILGIAADYTAFDFDIITHINSALMVVNQLGIGPPEGLQILDETTTWDELLLGDSMLSSVRTYVYLRVRLLFDPPNTSFLLKAQEEQLREYEWRLSVRRETLLHEEDSQPVIHPVSEPQPLPVAVAGSQHPRAHRRLLVRDPALADSEQDRGE